MSIKNYNDITKVIDENGNIKPIEDIFSILSENWDKINNKSPCANCPNKGKICHCTLGTPKIT